MSSDRFILPAATAHALADAFVALPGVHSLSPGRFGEIALLYPGDRVPGLKFLSPRDDTQLAVHVVVEVPTGTGNTGSPAAPTLAQLADFIREAAAAVCPELTRVDVVFADAAAGAPARR